MTGIRTRELFVRQFFGLLIRKVNHYTTRGPRIIVNFYSTYVTNPHLKTGVDSTPETLCEKHFRQWCAGNTLRAFYFHLFFCYFSFRLPIPSDVVVHKGVYECTCFPLTSPALPSCSCLVHGTVFTFRQRSSQVRFLLLSLFTR